MNIMENKKEVSGNLKGAAKRRLNIDKYWIDRHRYYELKQFCLQYPIWEKAYKSLRTLSANHDELVKVAEKKGKSFDCIIKECNDAMKFYCQRMVMIDQAAAKTGSNFSWCILKAVTTGTTYENLGIPCDKDEYCELYRKFFWLLNQARG